ncbi:hypothetical protein L7F22_037771 [Adiantum nelumboides]|nr:hypothetical protein [Adiantum nelumboides]
MFMRMLLLLLLLITAGQCSMCVAAGRSLDDVDDIAQQPSTLHTNASSFEALFVFGDSLLDPGNRHRLQPSAIGLPFPLIDADHLPYGRDFPSHTPTGRFSNGLIGSDILASFMGLPYPPPYLKDRSNVMKGSSFATSGSKILNKSSAYQFPRLNFPDQVRGFADVRRLMVSRLGLDEANLLISRSLFLTCFGANDLMADYLLNPVQRLRVSREDFYQSLTSPYAQFLQELYKLGARKFAVVSLPPLGCIPALRAVLGGRQNYWQCMSGVNEVVNGFNGALLRMTSALHQQGQQQQPMAAGFVYLNSYDAALDAVSTPSAYGFVHGLRPCCGYLEERVVPVCALGVNAVCQRASDHVFWDFAHPTEAFNSFLARLFWEGSSPHVYPINLRELARF